MATFQTYIYKKGKKGKKEKHCSQSFTQKLNIEKHKPLLKTENHPVGMQLLSVPLVVSIVLLVFKKISDEHIRRQIMNEKRGAGIGNTTNGTYTLSSVMQIVRLLIAQKSTVACSVILFTKTAFYYERTLKQWKIYQKINKTC